MLHVGRHCVPCTLISQEIIMRNNDELVVPTMFVSCCIPVTVSCQPRQLRDKYIHLYKFHFQAMVLCIQHLVPAKNPSITFFGEPKKDNQVINKLKRKCVFH